MSTNTGSVLGGTRLNIVGGYFYSDANLPAQIDISGTPCNVLSYERNNNFDSQLVCETAPKPSSTQTDFPGGMGITVIRDNVYTPSLTGAVPSANAVYSQLNDANYIDNQTVDATVWLKGYLLPAKTSKYDLSISTTGSAVLYLSTDATSANKVCTDRRKLKKLRSKKHNSKISHFY